jgi:aspartate-semialdehyde dehydrogenase
MPPSAAIRPDLPPGQQAQSRPAFVVAVVGATGAVGVEMARCLEQRNFPVSELRLLASARSASASAATPSPSRS